MCVPVCVGFIIFPRLRVQKNCFLTCYTRAISNVSQPSVYMQDTLIAVSSLDT